MGVNNGYSNAEFDRVCRAMMEKHLVERAVTQDKNSTIKLYYENISQGHIKKDESVMRHIIKQNCKPTDNKNLKLIIYYNNSRALNLVSRNNINKSDDKLSKTNMVYNYTCTAGDCATRDVCYVGYTTCTLSHRITYHMQQGSIKKHQVQHHNASITRSNSITIIAQSKKIRKLETLEPTHIREKSPAINI